jgi:hypothetical protein
MPLPVVLVASPVRDVPRAVYDSRSKTIRFEPEGDAPWPFEVNVSNELLLDFGADRRLIAGELLVARRAWSRVTIPPWPEGLPGRAIACAADAPASSFVELAVEVRWNEASQLGSILLGDAVEPTPNVRVSRSLAATVRDGVLCALHFEVRGRSE